MKCPGCGNNTISRLKVALDGFGARRYKCRKCGGLFKVKGSPVLYVLTAVSLVIALYPNVNMYFVVSSLAMLFATIYAIIAFRFFRPDRLSASILAAHKQHFLLRFSLSIPSILAIAVWLFGGLLCFPSQAYLLILNTHQQVDDTPLEMKDEYFMPDKACYGAFIQSLAEYGKNERDPYEDVDKLFSTGQTNVVISRSIVEHLHKKYGNRIAQFQKTADCEYHLQPVYNLEIKHKDLYEAGMSLQDLSLSFLCLASIDMAAGKKDDAIQKYLAVIKAAKMLMSMPIARTNNFQYGEYVYMSALDALNDRLDEGVMSVSDVRNILSSTGGNPFSYECARLHLSSEYDKNMKAYITRKSPQNIIIDIAVFLFYLHEHYKGKIAGGYIPIFNGLSGPYNEIKYPKTVTHDEWHKQKRTDAYMDALGSYPGLLRAKGDSYRIREVYYYGITAYNLFKIKLALIEYRIKNGRLPARLDELVPEFIEKLPRDEYDGHSLRYDSKRAVVYSVWGNLKDDGGLLPDLHKSVFLQKYILHMGDLAIEVPPEK